MHAVVVVKLPSPVRLFVTLWSAAFQASLPLPYPRICPSSCPLSQWCHPTITSSVAPFSFCLQPFPASVFSNESAVHIKWPKYWNFSISPFKVLMHARSSKNKKRERNPDSGTFRTSPHWIRDIRNKTTLNTGPNQNEIWSPN